MGPAGVCLCGCRLLGFVLPLSLVDSADWLKSATGAQTHTNVVVVRRKSSKSIGETYTHSALCVSAGAIVVMFSVHCVCVRRFVCLLIRLVGRSGCGWHRQRCCGCLVRRTELKRR